MTGDDYVPYNKPAAIHRWVLTSPPIDQMVLLIDPDFVFLAPVVSLSATRGMPETQPIGYMNPSSSPDLVKRHCRAPDSVQAVGCPILIHWDDLRLLAGAWLQKTEEIRNDQRSREKAGWVAEMWGYTFAAAEMGICHATRELALSQFDDRDDLPLIHYCYSSADSSGRWTWDKRSYRPWDSVADPTRRRTPKASIALIRLLNEWAKIQGNIFLNERSMEKDRPDQGLQGAHDWSSQRLSNSRIWRLV